MITQELLRSLFEYHPEGWFVWKQGTRRQGQRAGTKNAHKQRYQISVGSQMKWLHRMIYIYHYGDIPKYVDHIDGNPSNNRIENLRAATHAENTRNCRKYNKDSLFHPYKGVTWHKELWRARINYNKKQYYLGRFKRAEDAALAYDGMALILFAEFARTNFTY